LETLEISAQQTIYGLDSKGNLKVKIFSAVGDQFITTYGRFGGKMASSVKQCHVKNAGKSNWSPADDQARQMVGRGVIKDTEQEGYRLMPEEIIVEGAEAMIAYLSTSVVDDTAMLAWPVEWDRISDEAWLKGYLLSRKLDGIRDVAVFRNDRLQMQSRKQKPIDTMQHIVAELEPVMRALCHASGLKELRLDGELYNHEYHDNFEDLVSAIKKYKPGVSELLKYNIYGIIDFELCASDRYDVQKYYFSGLNTCEVVEQVLVHSREEVMAYHKLWTSQGYEGAMLLDPFSMYVQSRSYNLMKVKEMKTEEFTIIDVIPMDAKPNLGLMVLVTADGKQFKATPKCDEAKKAWYLQHRDEIIFKSGTVQYFSLTKSGVPRLPVFITVRDYE
jgi:hypothetical protein